jgi:hypothetical protein|tara:strand:- start:47 stop:238 length:192 start_codon:yes stop_codon:yes gene_type:complete
MITYDFSVDSLICVEAPRGTDPETLVEAAKQKLTEYIKTDNIVLTFENVFDPDTGDYCDEWEN